MAAVRDIRFLVNEKQKIGSRFSDCGPFEISRQAFPRIILEVARSSRRAADQGYATAQDSIVLRGQGRASGFLPPGCPPVPQAADRGDPLGRGQSRPGVLSGNGSARGPCRGCSLLPKEQPIKVMRALNMISAPCDWKHRGPVECAHGTHDSS